MKSKYVLLVICGLLFATAAVAQAALVSENYLLNGSFEQVVAGSGKDFMNWDEGGEWYRSSLALTGSSAARLGVGTGNLYQSFLVNSNVGTLIYGAYFRIITDTLSGNWDQAQINLQLNGGHTIGGSISNFSGLTFSPWQGAQFISNWFLVSGSIDLASLTGFPLGSSINISMQNFNPAITKLMVDDAFVGPAVPVPAAAWLLGTGLIGLAVIRKRRSN